MKKVLALLFCFVYLLSSAGVHINLHYCGGKMKSVSFLHSNEADCCGSKMKKRDCCKEKAINVNALAGKGHAEKQVLVKPSQLSNDLILINELPILSIKTAKLSTLIRREPPDIVNNRLYLSVGVLRI